MASEEWTKIKSLAELQDTKLTLLGNARRHLYKSLESAISVPTFHVAQGSVSSHTSIAAISSSQPNILVVEHPCGWYMCTEITGQIGCGESSGWSSLSLSFGWWQDRHFFLVGVGMIPVALTLVFRLWSNEQQWLQVGQESRQARSLAGLRLLWMRQNFHWRDLEWQKRVYDFEPILSVWLNSG